MCCFSISGRQDRWRIPVICILMHSICSGQTNAYWKTPAHRPPPRAAPYRVALFSPQHGEDRARLWSQTKSMAVYGFGVIGVIYALPEDSTGWERDANIMGKWSRNLGNGMEWDRNDWAYNYIGHAYFGGVYYQVARKSGYRQWDAAVYAFLMSTFYWEYGIEAFAEVPSVQDLVSTPLLGWLYGEWAYRTEIGIRAHQNQLLGSRLLGNTVLFLLDPVDRLGSGVNRVTGRRLIKSGYGYFSYAAVPVENTTDHRLYLNLQFPMGGIADDEPQQRPLEWQDDPVDTGIIGFSLGRGRTQLDHAWGVKNDDYTKATLGLYFTPRWSARLAYAWGNVKQRSSGTSLAYENYSMDVQRCFFSGRRWRPYLSAGCGEQMFIKDKGPKTLQLNAGLGLHVKLHRKWALQADWIHYRGIEQSRYDRQLNAGVVYRFGRGEHHGW